MDGVAQVATGTGFLPCWKAAAPARRGRYASGMSSNRMRISKREHGAPRLRDWRLHFRQEKDLAASGQNVAARRSFDHQLDPAELFGLIEQRFCGAA